MAQVPVLDPNQVVAPTDRPASARAQDYFNLRTPTATPADFGGLGAQALGGAGRDLSGAGDVLAQRANASAAIANENAARTASTDTVQSMASTMSDYLQKRGQDAVQGFDDFNSKIKQAVKDAGDSMTNPMAKNMVLTSLTRMQMAMFEGAARHRATELNAWTVQSHTQGAQTFADQAMTFRNDPDKVEGLIGAGMNEIAGVASVYGWDATTAEQKQRQYAGKAWSSVIKSVAVDDPLRAQQYFNSHRDLMDANDQAQIGEWLKSRGDKAADDAFLGSVIHNGSVIPASANVDNIMSGVVWKESRGHQFDSSGAPLVSVKLAGQSDAPVGVSQIKPSTAEAAAKTIGVVFDPDKLRNDQNYNLLLGKAELNRLIGVYQNPTLALAAYNAGQGRVDGWLKTIGDPRTGQVSFPDFVSRIPIDETRDYVQSISGAVTSQLGYPAPTAEGTPVAMTREQAIQRAIGSSPDADVQLRRMSKVNEYYQLLQHGNAQFKADLNSRLADLAPAALAGENVVIPESDIRKAYQDDAPRGAQLIANLKADAFAGQLFQQLKYATPDERQQIQNDLLTGTGMFKDVLKGKAAQLIGGVVVPGAEEAPGDVSFRTRNMIFQRLEGLQQAQAEALKSDAATYVMGVPGVREAYQATQGPTAAPDALANYARVTAAAQVHLGVDPNDVQILPAADVATLAKKFMTTDPTTQDLGPVMASMQTQFGSSWSQVYKQLVTQGHLPSNAQSMAWMDAPGQDAARQDFTHALQFAGKEGLKKLREAAPKAAVTDINKDIDSALADARATIMSPGRATAGLNAWQNLRDTVEMVALYRTIQNGGDGRSNLTKAIDDAVNAKWDFSGQTYRTPKFDDGGRPISFANVEGAAAAIRAGVDPNTVKREAGNADLTDEQWHRIIGNSPMTWVNNNDGSGIYLVQQSAKGSWSPLHKQDGSMWELKFADAARLQQNMTHTAAADAIPGL